MSNEDKVAYSIFYSGCLKNKPYEKSFFGLKVNKTSSTKIGGAARLTCPDEPKI